MKRALTAAAVVLACVVVSGQEQPDTRRRLQIRVAAVDRAGKPVMDLRPNEFEVSINVYRVPIETVTVVRPESAPPRIFMLLFDDLVTSPATVPRVREIARAIVGRMGQNDQMTIAPLSGVFSKPTADRARLLQMIDDYNGMALGALPVDRLGEYILEKVTAVSRDVAEVDMRKIVIGIGTAWIFDTPIAPPGVGRDLRREWTAAVRAMAAADVNLYVIDSGGVGRAPISPARGFATESGGHAFTNTNDFKGAVERIVAEATHYYVLTVADPPTGRNDELRELDVRILRADVRARARRWLSGGATPSRTP